MASSGVVCFLGIDELSLEMAALLVNAGHQIKAFEIAECGLMSQFLELGGSQCDDFADAVREHNTAHTLSISVHFLNNGRRRPLRLHISIAIAAQFAFCDVAAFVLTASDLYDEIITGTQGLRDGTVFIIRSTLPLKQAQSLEKHLNESGNVILIGIHILKASPDAFNEKLTAAAFGKMETISAAEHILSDMCGQTFNFDQEACTGSKVRMVDELLKCIHFSASLEAIFLGTKAGIHPWILYDIISNAAGNSWIFEDCGPKLLKGDNSMATTSNDLLHNVTIRSKLKVDNVIHCELHWMPMLVGLGLHGDSGGVQMPSKETQMSVRAAAKEFMFPLPLLAVAQQQLIIAKPRDPDSDGIIKVWEKYFGVSIRDAAEKEMYSPSLLGEKIMTVSPGIRRIAFIGLGAMGFGMATHLLKSNFSVIGYDVYEPVLQIFSDFGGSVGHSPAEVCRDVDVLIIMVANDIQADSILFGDGGSVPGIRNEKTLELFLLGTSIILCSTVSPGYVTKLEQRLKDENKKLKLVDAPVSGGVKRAADGTFTIMASATQEALEHTSSVLSALSEKLYVIRGGCGAASSVKMVNQLLAGVHIAAAAEAMAFGARCGLETRMLFDLITRSQGNSWMFGNRAPHMLDNDYTPYSAIDIFVKDLGIVSNEGSILSIPLNLSAIAHQQFVAGSASGWGRLDDAAVVKVYEKLTGITVEGRHAIRSTEEVLKLLPMEWPEDPFSKIKETQNKNSNKILIVLDDDPTGTQTVHDIKALTEWSVDSLVEEFKKRPECFFILTNSRSLSSEKAYSLTQEICRNIDIAARLAGDIDFSVVLRGDSTLRGHFPEEPDAVVSVLGEMDAWIICPFFLQGGCYTINNIHYVSDSGSLVPAGDTEFSKDAAFGYNSSNLCEWVEEKTKGRVSASSVASISIQLIRKGGPAAVCEHLLNLPKGSICIVNAASDQDMTVFAAGMIQAERKGTRFLCRTAASFVSACIGIKPKPPISPACIAGRLVKGGGLIVVGSYVPKTTKQVMMLKSKLEHAIKSIEVLVEKLSMSSSENREAEISHAAETASSYLKLGKDVLLMTSRDLIKGRTPSESLEINFQVSSGLVEIVRRISIRPRYILAKGGITSSDLATKAFEARRAKVVGQALPGVPFWELGPESRYPGIPFIVFPGNVGNVNALAEVVQKWSNPLTTSLTKALLINAEQNKYAIGAFNVYNLEGIEAVIADAEAEKSPAILQVHPGALKLSRCLLVSCCIYATERAKVPIAVQFDHGSTQQELVEALELGFNSTMVDGSDLTLEDNISFTKRLALLAQARNIMVEAELSRLSGTEDESTVEDFEAKLTDPSQAEKFIDETGIDALAVCIGNVHGKYPSSGPNLNLDLLKDLNEVALKKGVSIVLHGASGLPEELVKECIEGGVCKLNVNTEVRSAYVESLRGEGRRGDLVSVMSVAKEAMKAIVVNKMRLFGSSGRAW
ncbi:ketose-bisphosphate aldolase class-II family protein [Wolffia australiana]